MFKLAASLRVHPEVSLQRKVDLNTWRDVDEGAPAPYCSVQHDKFVVVDRDASGHKIFLHKFRVFLYSDVHVFEDDTLLLQFFLQVVVDN